MKEQVKAVFEHLEQGQLSHAEKGPVGGWKTPLPGGHIVARSTLQAEARPLIAFGIEAVPQLLPWVKHHNAAIRYVAVFALEQITGERPDTLYFDDDDIDGNRDRAIEVWQRWYDTHHAPR